MTFNTIVALATAPLPSALAIIRLSGFDAFEIAQKMSDQTFTSLTEKTILIGKILDGEKTIDQVVFLAFVGPRSFTGENIVEIVCHGSMIAIQEIIALAIKHGARHAEPGEFSSRAYLNQKMDLVQAEAIHDMIASVTPESKALAVRALEGQTSRLLVPIKTKIADLLSLIEVNIDYPEYEDIEKVSLKKVVSDTQEMIDMLGDLIQLGKKGRVIHEGVTVGIVGKPNVGKSSLLNSLINEEKAIVTPIPGTTRDTVEAEVNFNGILLKLLDTAGIRKNPKMIEAIGIEKSKDIIKNADLVLVVLDGSKPLTAEDETILKLTENKKRLIVYNKADLVKKPKPNALYISALTKDISALQKAIFDIFGISEKSFNSPSFYATRQLAKLEQMGEALKKANTDASNGMTLDLISVSLQEAYQHAINLLGLEGSTDLSTEIFSRFCVGK